MDSITKLQSKLREAESILQYVSKELDGYAEAKSSVGSKINFAEIKLRGEQYSFYEHPLKKQIFQDEYFALLIYVISLGGKKEEGWTLLYRIAAGCDYRKDLQNLTTDAMTLSEERLSEIIRMIYSAELARTFALDSLMICYHMGADDAQLKFLSNFYGLLKLDKNFLTEAIQFVKVFDATFWDNLAEKSRPWKYLAAKDIATYIGGYPAASFAEAAKLNFKRIVISGVTYTGEDVLNLDKWTTDEILFADCRFENCGGIYSNYRIVKFVNCSFDGNVERYADTCSDPYYVKYTWTDNKYSSYRAFLHFVKAEFVTCSFTNFKDGIPMLYLTDGMIHSCNLKKCKQVCGGSMLINLNNAKMIDNKFEFCSSDVSAGSMGIRSYNGSGQGCMIYSLNSILKKNTFLYCENTVSSSQNHSCFSCLVLLDKNSICQECLFENNTTTGMIHRGISYPSHFNGTIIGLHDSEQKNNTGDFSVDVVNNISKDMFYIGDKPYDN